MICRLLGFCSDPLRRVEKYKQENTLVSPHNADILFFNYTGAEGINGLTLAPLASL